MIFSESNHWTAGKWERDLFTCQVVMDSWVCITKQESRLHELDLDNERSLVFKAKLETETQKMKNEYEFLHSQLICQ